jgi:hypothetical protein
VRRAMSSLEASAMHALEESNCRRDTMKQHENYDLVSRSPRKAVTRALVLGAWLAAGVLATFSTMAQDENVREEGPVVRTAEGPVRGFVRSGVSVFLGIPYAAPPVGNLRWRPPQPVERWDEPLDATHYANTCPQVTELGAFAGPSSITEDCLYLNVFTFAVGMPITSSMLRSRLLQERRRGMKETLRYKAAKLALGNADEVKSTINDLVDHGTYLDAFPDALEPAR